MSEVEWLEEFGDNLSSMLKEANMSQKELAFETGLSEASISSYVNGRKLPGPKALVNISHTLDCSLEDLMDFGELIG
jgi:transcriptional regulator with XRE-family HTH domain